MLHYILVRHGESIANVDKHIRHSVRECDIMLTEEGVQQSQKAGKEIKNIIQQLRAQSETTPKTLAIVSPYIRAKETFYCMKKEMKEEIDFDYEDVRLRELDHGDLHGCNESQYQQRKSDISARGGHFYYYYPNGESYTDLLTRLSTLHNELLGEWRESNYKPTIVLMVAHAHVLAAMDVLLGKKNVHFLDYKMANCVIRQYSKKVSQTMHACID